MAQAGLHTYISILLTNKLPKKQWFFYSFLFAAILPDIDIIFSIFNKIITNSPYDFIFSTTIFHSIITTTIIYLIILIVYEFKKNTYILHIANGYALGTTLHLIIDILFWLRPIHILWPLPVNPINIWSAVDIPIQVILIHALLEIFFFRLFAYQMINIILSNTKVNSNVIKLLSIWMKINFYLLLIYAILTCTLDSHSLFIIFSIIYTPSISLLLFTLYKLRNNINNFSLLIDKKDLNIKVDRKSTIDNIG